MTPHDRLTERRMLHLTAADVARVARLAERLPLRPGALLRELVRVGAAAVEADPAMLLRGRVTA